MASHNPQWDEAFVTATGHTPTFANTTDWLVWHLTHVENLEGILGSGSLLNFHQAVPKVRVALNSVQTRRSTTIIHGCEGYPPGMTLHDHVPFYFSARSPMQYLISQGHPDYSGGTEQLIFVGVRIGTISERGYTWCFSDRNATIAGAQFRSRISDIPQTISLDILGRRYWHDSPELDAAQRRQAEFLVLNQVPLQDCAAIVTQNSQTLAIVEHALNGQDLPLVASCQPGFYFGKG